MWSRKLLNIKYILYPNKPAHKILITIHSVFVGPFLLNLDLFPASLSSFQSYHWSSDVSLTLLSALVRRVNFFINCTLRMRTEIKKRTRKTWYQWSRKKSGKNGGLLNKMREMFKGRINSKSLARDIAPLLCVKTIINNLTYSPRGHNIWLSRKYWVNCFSNGKEPIYTDWNLRDFNNYCKTPNSTKMINLTFSIKTNKKHLVRLNINMVICVVGLFIYIIY